MSTLINNLLNIKFHLVGGLPNMIAKRKYITKKARNFKINLLIESGTYLGQSTRYFARHFNTVYTIELSEELFNFAKKNMALQNIKFYQGNSAEILQKIVNELKTGAVFFLDAHMSGGVTVAGETATPVRIELAILENFPHLKNSILILDDARGFDGTNSYPAFEEIIIWAKKLNLGRVYSELDMIIIDPVIL